MRFGSIFFSIRLVVIVCISHKNVSLSHFPFSVCLSLSFSFSFFLWAHFIRRCMYFLLVFCIWVGKKITFNYSSSEVYILFMYALLLLLMMLFLISHHPKKMKYVRVYESTLAFALCHLLINRASNSITDTFCSNKMTHKQMQNYYFTLYAQIYIAHTHTRAHTQLRWLCFVLKTFYCLRAYTHSVHTKNFSVSLSLYLASLSLSLSPFSSIL